MAVDHSVHITTRRSSDLIADIAYFYSLSIDGSMISVISMIRRGSVIVSFLYGVMALHEKNVKMKLIDLSVLLVGLVCLVLGSR